MNNDERNKLVSTEIKALLIAMHKGESLTLTLSKIMATIGGIKYVEERKFIYMLQSLQQEEMKGMPALVEDKKYLDGYNEAVGENNFAVKLGISAILGTDNNKKGEIE